MKRVHLWVDLLRSDNVGLSQGGSEAAMFMMLHFHISSLFPCSFPVVGIRNEHNDV